MFNAFLIMLVAVGISVVTGFLISLLIQILCLIVEHSASKTESPDDDLVALAIAAALARRSGK